MQHDLFALFVGKRSELLGVPGVGQYRIGDRRRKCDCTFTPREIVSHVINNDRDVSVGPEVVGTGCRDYFRFGQEGDGEKATGDKNRGPTKQFVHHCRR